MYNSNNDKKIQVLKKKKNTLVIGSISESQEDQYKHSATPYVYKVAGMEALLSQVSPVLILINYQVTLGKSTFFLLVSMPYL